MKDYIDNNKEFRLTLVEKLGVPRIYTGERKVTYDKVKIWAVKNIARVYAEKYIDEYFLTNSYVEVEIMKINYLIYKGKEYK